MMTRTRLVVYTGALCFIVSASGLLAEEGGKVAEEKETMLDLLWKGGPLMIPLGLASILALALAVERFISLQKDRVLPPGFLDGLNQAWKDDPTGQKAAEYCDSSGGAAGHVFKAGLRWRSAGYEAIGKAIEDAGSREAEKMKRSLRGLSIVAAVAPLIGLLGTVYGMISAFQRTAEGDGAAKPADLAGGIYEALVTTAAGLTIAIPVMLLYQFLLSRVDGLIDHIDEVGTEFVLSHADVQGAPGDFTGGAPATAPAEEG